MHGHHDVPIILDVTVNHGRVGPRHVLPVDLGVENGELRVVADPGILPLPMHTEGSFLRVEGFDLDAEDLHVWRFSEGSWLANVDIAALSMADARDGHAATGADPCRWQRCIRTRYTLFSFQKFQKCPQ